MVFSNENIIDKLCGGCDCVDFAPEVGFNYNAGAKTVTFTDTTNYPAGDSRKIIQLAIYDKNEKKLLGSIAADDGDDAVTINTATLDPSGGYRFYATVITDKGCLSDGHAEAVGISITEGKIGYWDKDNDDIGTGPAVES